MNLRYSVFGFLSGFGFRPSDLSGLGSWFAVTALLALGTAYPTDASSTVANDFFSPPRVHHISLTIGEAQLRALRAGPRTYVPAELSDGKGRFTNVEIHLKGATGSFRPIEDKPAFTVSFDRVADGQRFHGLSKIHLNNSIEDGSYLNEALGAELFRAAGVPAARVTHALVELNGKRLGLYVLKEGFTREFLTQYETSPVGRLFEPGEGHDIDERLDCKFDGHGTNRPALEALATTVHEQDPALRWKQFPGCLDLDEFISFMAMEVLLGHRDGYCLARNNFRIYDDATSGRAIFLPHGMDQLFGRAPDQLEPRMNGLLARAVMETREGSAAYRQRVGVLFTNLFVVPALHQRIDALATTLVPVLTRSEKAALAREIVDLKRRIVERHAVLAHVISEGPRHPVAFAGAPISLSDWQPMDASRGVVMDVVTIEQRQALRIAANGNSGAAWQTTLLLGPGNYRFEALARTDGVKDLPYGAHHGAVLRVGGERSEPLLGDAGWKVLSVEFAVMQASPVQLCCELRARAGQVWFRLDDLRLQKVH